MINCARAIVLALALAFALALVASGIHSVTEKQGFGGSGWAGILGPQRPVQSSPSPRTGKPGQTS